MSDEEIIKSLECCICNVDCDKCETPEELKDCCKCNEYLTKQAIDLINRQRAEIERFNKTIENIEKQIPEEVVTRKIDEDIELHYCPRCNVRFIRSGMKYCGECGQALDWGEEEGG